VSQYVNKLFKLWVERAVLLSGKKTRLADQPSGCLSSSSTTI
jgi:hypothetical protein